MSRVTAPLLVIMTLALVAPLGSAGGEGLHYGERVDLENTSLAPGGTLVVRSLESAALTNIAASSGSGLVVDSAGNASLEGLSCSGEGGTLSLHIVAAGTARLSGVALPSNCRAVIVVSAGTAVLSRIEAPGAQLVVASGGVRLENSTLGDVRILGAGSGRITGLNASILGIYGSGPLSVSNTTVSQLVEAYASSLALRRVRAPSARLVASNALVEESVFERVESSQSPHLALINARTGRVESVNTRLTVIAGTETGEIREKITSTYPWRDHWLIACCAPPGPSGPGNISTLTTVSLVLGSPGLERVGVAIIGMGLLQVEVTPPSNVSVPGAGLEVVVAKSTMLLVGGASLVTLLSPPPSGMRMETYILDNRVYLAPQAEISGAALAPGAGTSVVAGNRILVMGSTGQAPTLYVARPLGAGGIAWFFHNAIMSRVNLQPYPPGAGMAVSFTSLWPYKYNGTTVREIGNYYAWLNGTDANGDGIIDGPAGAPPLDTAPLAHDIQYYSPLSPLILEEGPRNGSTLAAVAKAAYGARLSAEPSGSTLVTTPSPGTSWEGPLSAYLATAWGAPGAVVETVEWASGVSTTTIQLAPSPLRVQPPVKAAPTVRLPPALLGAAAGLPLGLAAEGECAYSVMITSTPSRVGLEAGRSSLLVQGSVRASSYCLATPLLGTAAGALLQGGVLSGVYPFVAALVRSDGALMIAPTVLIVDSWPAPSNVTVARAETTQARTATTTTPPGPATTGPLTQAPAQQATPTPPPANPGRWLQVAVLLSALLGLVAVLQYRRRGGRAR